MKTSSFHQNYIGWHEHQFFRQIGASYDILPQINFFLQADLQPQPRDTFSFSPANKKVPKLLYEQLSQYRKENFSSRRNQQHLVVGREPRKESLLLQSNDYLHLASHPNIVSSQINTLQASSPDLVMSAVFLHQNSRKHEFEQAMADFLGFEFCVLGQSGWNINTGLIQTICTTALPVYIDMFAHMSLWEGIKCSNGIARPFRHNDTNHLEKMIRRYGPGVIIVDSIYSTNGSVAPLKRIANIASLYECIFVVDESHSLGTHGPQGAGLVAELGLTNQVHFITASLAKAFAARAGLLACSKYFGECFPYLSHPSIFSSTLLNHEIAGLQATLELIRNGDDLRARLHRNAEYLRNKLRDIGYTIHSESQIIAIETGTEEQTEIWRDELEERGVFGSVFCSPATPKNHALIRFSIHSNLTDSELEKIVDACLAIHKKFRFCEKTARPTLGETSSRHEDLLQLE